MAAARRGARSVPIGSTLTTSGAGDRGKAPHHDEEEHAEEEDADEGAERERERGVGDHRTTGSAIVLDVSGGRAAAHRHRGDRGHQRDRRLDDEHRPPVEELGDRTAEHRPERGAGHARSGPPAGGAAGVAEQGHEHAERAGDERRATHALHDAGGDERGERRREPGGERRGGEHGGTRRGRGSRR